MNMKIAIIVPYANITYSGGLLVQGRMWKDGLERLGCMVDLVSPWGKYDWESYDYILFLGLGKLLWDYLYLFKSCKHPIIISAPVIDYPGSMLSFKLRARFLGSSKLRIFKLLHDYYCCKDMFSFFLVRSEYEKKFLTEGMKIDERKVFVVPISLRFANEVPEVDFAIKEKFCFHASRLGDAGKNVPKLIDAAKKYGFSLVLAGTLNGEKQRFWLENLIDGAENIHYVGYLSDEQLFAYYRRCRAFALPSLIEGVGMVALEAAVYGAEIVLTDLGAPKEYYGGRAFLVNPNDVDSIGQGIVKALNEGRSQPELRKFVLDNYNLMRCTGLLYNILKDRCNG